MIGRHSELQVYREIFRSTAVWQCLGGALLIPIAYLFRGTPLPVFPALSLGDLLFLLSMAINGFSIIVEAGKGLLAREINVDELVSIALIACLFTGNYAEGAMVSAIMVMGALVEEAVSDQARGAIRALVAATPDTAVVEKDGIEKTIALTAVKPGDRLVIRAGDTIAVDGTIIDGSTSVNESSITGESIPVDKRIGDAVYAGTVCVDGFIRVRADRVGRDSTMGRITEMVAAAEQQQTEGGKIVDQYATWFTPVILGIAVLTYFLTRDMTRAITVLIVGCPCSFLLASPVSTVAAIGRAAQSGIVIKGGRYLENLALATGFFFDKTGTLTQGKPVVVEIRPGDDYDAQAVMRMAAAVEKGSLHPLGIAIVEKAMSMQIVLPQATEVRTEIGRGITGRVDHHRVAIMAARRSDTRSLTVVDVWVDEKLAGSIALFDPLRETARETVKALRREGIVDLVILSGDHTSVVYQIAQEAGVTQFHAEQKPDEKLAQIQAYTKGKVVYVGDGINDALALKAASTGIAMGMRGVDVALETADIVLMNDRLEQLPFLIRLGRKMSRTIKIGLVLSLGINLAALAASAFGLLTPILGAVTHNVGSILVVTLAASLRFTQE